MIGSRSEVWKKGVLEEVVPSQIFHILWTGQFSQNDPLPFFSIAFIIIRSLNLAEWRRLK